MRSAPSLSADLLTLAIPDCPNPCPPLQVGQKTPFPELYVFRGPAQADGYDWYLAATAPEDALYTEYLGWVAGGDESGPWLRFHEPTCPPPPVELSDITYSALSRFEAVACFGGQPLTVRGWYVELPPDADVNGDCPEEPAWLLCGFGYHMLRPEPGAYYGDGNNLPMQVDPLSSVQMPARGSWALVTGMFDHPASHACGTDAENQIAAQMQCRMEFVVTAASSG
jgi:hypothetical protein